MLSANVRAAIAPTTSDAYLRGACGDMFQAPNFFQVFRGDGTLRYSTYVLPGDKRGVDGLYEEYRTRNSRPATPFLACVTDAANRRNNGSVSPGQIVTILGNGIGPKDGVTATPGPDGRYPTAFGALRVFAGDLPVPLLYADSGQINGILPFSLPPGKPTPITIELEGRRVSAEQQVIPASIHLFSLDGSGSGQAVALNEDGRLNSLSNPAWPGSIVVIYATGGGATVPPAVDGGLAPLGPLAALPRPLSPVTLELSGYRFSATGEVLYAGAAPVLVNGLMQINIRLPDQVPESPLVFASFVMDGVSMQNYEVSIAAGPRR